MDFIEFDDSIETSECLNDEDIIALVWSPPVDQIEEENMSIDRVELKEKEKID